MGDAGSAFESPKARTPNRTFTFYTIRACIGSTLCLTTTKAREGRGLGCGPRNSSFGLRSFYFSRNNGFLVC